MFYNTLIRFLFGSEFLFEFNSQPNVTCVSEKLRRIFDEHPIPIRFKPKSSELCLPGQIRQTETEQCCSGYPE